MVQLKLKPDLEDKVRERLSAGVDANDLMEAALQALSEQDAIRLEVMRGWEQADAGDFVDSNAKAVIDRAQRQQ